MLQYTFIFDTVRTEMPFRFIIILFVFLSHPIKIYHLSHSAPPFLPHHLLSPTLFSSPISSFLLHTAIFLSILPSTSSLPSLIYKNQVHRFFFPFSPFFFGSLLSVLWSDIPNRKFISELPIRRSIWATTDLLSTISQIPPSAHYKISFTGYFSPFFPFFFHSLPSGLWSHTPNRFSSSQSCRFAVQAWYRRSEVHLGIAIRQLEVHLGIADRKFILVSPYR